MLLIRYCFVFLCRINQHCRQCSSVTFVTSNNVKNICLFAFNFPQRLSQVSILVGKAIIRQYRKGLLQWGKIIHQSSQTNLNVTFPISFVSTCYAISFAMETTITDSANMADISVQSLDKTGFSHRIRSSGQGPCDYWIAVGK